MVNLVLNLILFVDFRGCGVCSQTKTGGHDHYMSMHGEDVADRRARLRTPTKIEHILAPTWPAQVAMETKLPER